MPRSALDRLGWQVVLLTNQRCCGPCREQEDITTADMHCCDDDESALLVMLARHGRKWEGRARRRVAFSVEGQFMMSSVSEVCMAYQGVPALQILVWQLLCNQMASGYSQLDCGSRPNDAGTHTGATPCAGPLQSACLLPW